MPEPLGVVAAFTAWNFPAVLAARKLGAALAAGCTVVLKAAEETPRTAAEVVRALADAGLPPGAVNLVFGDPPRGLRAPDRRAGGPRDHLHRLDRGRPDLAGLAAADLKRCVLELGGHAPVIVCAGRRRRPRRRATLPAKFGSAGQSCVAPSRFYVHADRYEAFAERVHAPRALRVGAPGTAPRSAR